ncbi:MAG: phosphoglycerate kinase [Longimicrobiales bacterium]|nr:phosphoglycerate kinase [Longimicrobiales bacterium]
MATALLGDLPDAALRGTLVLVRLDLNVPLDGDRVLDDTRIDASLPTLHYLCERGARVVIASHLGRPEGRDPRASLGPVAARLAERLGRSVAFVPETVGEAARATIDALGEGDLLLLENTRFEAGEVSNDDAFARELAGDATLFVQDAFGSAHRAHASTEGAARVIRERGGLAVSGLLLARELKWLVSALESPEPPFVLVMGGAKMTGKIDVISAFLPRVDRLLIGGAMANTFLVAQGREVGGSLFEPSRVDLARRLIEEAGETLLLPIDGRSATVPEGDLSRARPGRVIGRDERVPDGEELLDIGPATVERYSEVISTARTIVWNGPMGVFEHPDFGEGSFGVARAIAAATDAGAVSVVGGGESAAAAAAAGVEDRLTHISTGGGAALSLLAGEALPGVEVLSDATEVAG